MTGTFFEHSKLTYTKWLEILDCEISGQTLRETSYRTKLSVRTCFYMRHKLYTAFRKFQAVVLKGDVQLDTTFVDIELKGMKLMPKPVKGSRKNPPAKILFDREPQIAICTARDSSGHILFEIAGTDGENSAKYQKYRERFDDHCTIISDESSAIKKFTRDNSLNWVPLTEGRHKLKDGRNISVVNSLHSELKDLIRKKRGVSLRHLQGYLNWIIFRHMGHSLVREYYQLEAYYSIMHERKELCNAEISRRPFPVSLKDIYGKYQYGLFAPTQSFN